MKLPDVRISFVWVILLCGVISLLFIAGNLFVHGLHRHPESPHLYLSGADLNAGRAAITRYGCGGCHIIPGIAAASGRVGPSLSGIDQQTFLGGMLDNNPENMMHWIRHPQKISPGSAMPDLGVSEEEARHIAAYLYSASKNRFQRWWYILAW